jgi:HEAT repeat protein
MESEADTRPGRVLWMITLGLLALMIANSGCSRERSAISDLGSDSPLERAAAAESLGVWGVHRAQRTLLGLVRDPVAGVRTRAMEALGYVGDSLAVQVLRHALLYDRDRGVRFAAAVALGRSCPDSGIAFITPYLEGPTSGVSLRCARGLTALMKDVDSIGPWARVAAGRSLTGVVMSSLSAREELPGNIHAWENYVRGSIASEDTAEVLADQALITLGWLGSSEAGNGIVSAFRGTVSRAVMDSLLSIIATRNDTVLVRALLAELNTGVVATRKRAIRRLGGLPVPLVERALANAGGRRNNPAGAEAWKSLLRIHGVRLVPTDPPEVQAPLTPWAPSVLTAARRVQRHSRDPLTRVRAGTVLLLAGDPIGSQGILSGQRGSRTALREACHALGVIPPNHMAAIFGKMRRSVVRLMNSGSSRSHVAGLTAMRAGTYRGGNERVRSLLESGDVKVVRAAIQMIAVRRDTFMLVDLLPLMGHTDPETRSLAARTVALLTDRDSVRYLVLALTTDIVSRRRGAVEAIGYVAKGVWRTPSAPAYGKKLSHATTWIIRMLQREVVPGDRARAAWALGYIDAYGVNDALGMALGDVSEAVRAEAALALGRRLPQYSLPSLMQLAMNGGRVHRKRAVKAMVSIGTDHALLAVRQVSVVDGDADVRSLARQCITHF